MGERRKRICRWLAAGAAAAALTCASAIGVFAAGFAEIEQTEEMLGALPAVIDLKQTKGTTNSITLQWKRPAGAEAYSVKIKGYRESENAYATVEEFFDSRETVTYTISHLKAGAKYEVRVFAGSAADPSGNTRTITCKTTPGTVSGVTYVSYPATKRLNFSWNRQESADGYELYKYSLEGRLLARYEMKGSVSTSKTIGVGSNFYSYRIRAYSMINGKKVNGKLKYFYTAIQPKGNMVRQVPGSSTATIDWSKINGAYYEIYLATSQNGTYKLAKTSTATQTTLTGLKPGVKYWLKIKAVKMIDAKPRRSSGNFLHYFTKK